MDVVAFKLKSGLDIIGKVNKETQAAGGTWEVLSPMLISAYRTHQGMEVSLVPFFMFAKDRQKHNEVGIPLDKDDYFRAYEPDAQLANSYLEQTSGIAIAANPHPSPMKI